MQNGLLNGTKTCNKCFGSKQFIMPFHRVENGKHEYSMIAVMSHHTRSYRFYGWWRVALNYLNSKQLLLLKYVGWYLFSKFLFITRNILRKKRRKKDVLFSLLFNSFYFILLLLFFFSLEKRNFLLFDSLKQVFSSYH